MPPKTENTPRAQAFLNYLSSTEAEAWTEEIIDQSSPSTTRTHHRSIKILEKYHTS
ncbi:hypothetical protein I4U23_005020 [Adineta vaga]|nr:hypothetical protein I4U23_005020 [Adineta vaga]